MTWYTGTCSIMAKSLQYELSVWSLCVWGGFGFNSFVTKMQPFPMDGDYRIDVISGVGYPRLDSVLLLVLRMVCCAMARTLRLYYRFFETTSTLLRMGNISGRPYC
jgi:hypothetical protein